MPQPQPRHRLPLAQAAAAALLGSAVGTASPAEAPTSALPTVTVEGHYLNGLGSSDAASAGSITAGLIASRPALRTGELLEFVPGVIVTQHSGDGKANQYFLRGFNLDHGTDFATFVDGMPVNARTHAHGQGYSDLNFLIPELVQRIDYRKGPYDAADGDFASAGAAHIHLMDTLAQGQAALTGGQNGYARAVLLQSTAVASGQLVAALETARNNGPWQVTEGARRVNGALRWAAAGEGGARSSLTLLGYSARWRATDQIPLRAVLAGTLDRYGALSPSDGGHTARLSLSGQHQQPVPDGLWQFSAYAIRSRVSLLGDFTYFLKHPSDLDPSQPAGDQIEQLEQRLTWGGELRRRYDGLLFGRDSTTTVGLQGRQDRLAPVAVYQATAGQRGAAVQSARVRESSAGAYVDNATSWTPWLRSVLGLRADRYRFDVASTVAANSGVRAAALASPKFSLALGPWKQTELFVNAGNGFHSNDARGVTARVSPTSGEPVTPVPGLVRSRGAELGLRGQWLPGLQTSVALWRLDLGSELVFSGDAGDTAPSGATRRQGIEFNHHWVISPTWLLDADLALSQARFTTPQGDAPRVGTAVPGAVRSVLSLGATVTEHGPWSGHLGLRYFGPRPLVEDGSVGSQASTLVYARVGWRAAARWRLSLDVFNLFNRRVSDIDYFYASRLPGEPAGGVEDRHFHPSEPRSWRLVLQAPF
jgi:outer membrane receptor protein involved in Fe transport